MFQALWVIGIQIEMHAQVVLPHVGEFLLRFQQDPLFRDARN